MIHNVEPIAYSRKTENDSSNHCGRHFTCFPWERVKWTWKNEL